MGITSGSGMGMGMKPRLNPGVGMGMNHWEWEGIGFKKSFPLISSLDPLSRFISSFAQTSVIFIDVSMG